MLPNQKKSSIPQKPINSSDDTTSIIDEDIPIERELDITTGDVYEKYYFPGKYLRFNLNGLPFSFEFFVFEVQRKDEKIISISIEADDIVPQNIINITNVLTGTSPSNEDILKSEENLTLKLAIRDEIIEGVINPQIKSVEDTEIQNLLKIQDDYSKQYVLSDFYFYKVVSVGGA